MGRISFCSLVIDVFLHQNCEMVITIGGGPKRSGEPREQWAIQSRSLGSKPPE